MSKKWTIEKTKAYVNKVLKGKQKAGLTYCSAIQFLMIYINNEVKLHSLATKEDDNDIDRIDS